MTQYKGYYIDHVYFNSKADIDEFIKNKAIEAFKVSVELFAWNPSHERATYSHQKAEVLVKQHGLTWDEVDEIEASVYEAMAA